MDFNVLTCIKNCFKCFGNPFPNEKKINESPEGSISSRLSKIIANTPFVGWLYLSVSSILKADTKVPNPDTAHKTHSVFSRV